MARARLERIALPKIGEPVTIKPSKRRLVCLYQMLTCCQNKDREKSQSKAENYSPEAETTSPRTSNAWTKKEDTDSAQESSKAIESKESPEDTKPPNASARTRTRGAKGKGGWLGGLGSIFEGPIQKSDQPDKWVAVSVDLTKETCVVQSAKGYQLSKSVAQTRWRSAATKIHALQAFTTAPKRAKLRPKPTEDEQDAPELQNREADADKVRSAAANRFRHEAFEDENEVKSPKKNNKQKTGKETPVERKNSSSPKAATIEYGPQYTFTYPASVLTNSRIKAQRAEAFAKSKIFMSLQLSGIAVYHVVEVLLRCATFALTAVMFRFLYVP